jgi:Domain of unknown function (DUF6766)
MAQRTAEHAPSRRATTKPLRQWIADHGLSLSFASLFAVCIAGQSICGHISYNSELALHGFPAVGYLGYLRTGNFLDGAFVNWQAALLQLGCLIVFAAKFREKGAAHSLSPRIHGLRKRNQDGRHRPWVYRHSLSLAFAALFAASFIAHLFFGAMDYNSSLQMIHKPQITTVEYGRSSAFWFSNAQTWEAEFAALVIYILLSVFLRQQGSPESKPVDSSNDVTGKTNH